MSPIARLIGRTYQVPLLGVIREWVELHRPPNAADLLEQIAAKARELREAN